MYTELDIAIVSLAKVNCKIVKSRGLRMDPWGTPLNTFCYLGHLRQHTFIYQIGNLWEIPTNTITVNFISSY